MIEKILRFSLRQRFLILILSLVLIGLGIWAAKNLPIDAVPDVTNVQVQINTAVPALAPDESPDRAHEELLAEALLEPVDGKIDGDVLDDNQCHVPFSPPLRASTASVRGSGRTPRA